MESKQNSHFVAVSFPFIAFRGEGLFQWLQCRSSQASNWMAHVSVRRVGLWEVGWSKANLNPLVGGTLQGILSTGQNGEEGFYM